MNILIYRKIMWEYIQDALKNSDGTNAGIAEYLSSIQVKGWLVRNKIEKQRALADARTAFEEHRHWPLQIVLSHLGLDEKEFSR